jgi:hypothetical protein
MRLKELLIESSSPINFTTKKQVVDFFHKTCGIKRKNITVAKDTTGFSVDLVAEHNGVDYNGWECYGYEFAEWAPIPITSFSGEYYLRNENIKTLKNLPKDAPHLNLTILKCPKLVSLTGLPEKVKSISLKELNVDHLGGLPLVSAKITINGLDHLVGDVFENNVKTEYLSIFGCQRLNIFETVLPTAEMIFLARLPGTNFKKLTNIHKSIRAAEIVIFDNNSIEIESNVLDLFNVNGLKAVGNEHVSPYQTFENTNTNLPKWMQIVNKYLPSKDVFECQDELLSAGLVAYAKR